MLKIFDPTNSRTHVCLISGLVPVDTQLLDVQDKLFLYSVNIMVEIMSIVAGADNYFFLSSVLTD